MTGAELKIEQSSKSTIPEWLNAVNYVRVAILVVVVAVVITFPGCGSFFRLCHDCPPPPKQLDFVYTANAAGNASTVSALAADPTSGALTAVAGSPYNTGSGSVALAKNVAPSAVYVANSLSGDISAFIIDGNTGGLSAIAGSPFKAESGIDSIAIGLDGRFLYAVSGNSSNLWIFSIDPSGVLAPLKGTPVGIGVGITSSSIIIDASGKYVYVMGQASSSSAIYGFSRNSGTGAITPLPGFPVSVDGLANKSTFDRGGAFLLVTGTNVFGRSGGIDVFSFNAGTGALTLAGPAVQVGGDPAGIVMANGGHVYVPNTADATVSAFTFNFNTGAMTPVSGSPFPSGGKGSINGPLGITTNDAGNFAFVCNASSDISVFSVNSSGTLSPVAGSPFPDGGNAPIAIVLVE